MTHWISGPFRFSNSTHCCVRMPSFIQTDHIRPAKFHGKEGNKEEGNREQRSRGSAFYLDHDVIIHTTSHRWGAGRSTLGMYDSCHGNRCAGHCCLCVMPQGSEKICYTGSCYQHISLFLIIKRKNKRGGGSRWWKGNRCVMSLKLLPAV